MDLSDKKSFIVLPEEVLPGDGVVGSAERIGSKRIRIDDLLNEVTDTNPLGKKILTPIRNTAKINTVKPKTKKKVKKLDSTLAKDYLDSPCSLSWRDYLKSKSKKEVALFLRSLHSELKGKSYSKVSFFGEDEESETDEEEDDSEPECVNGMVEGKCYMPVSISGVTLPVYVDDGSHYCIMSKRLATKLNLQVTKEDIKIRPIGGRSLSIIGYSITPVTIATDVTIKIKFRIMEDPAVDLLIGLDLLQSLGIVKDFFTETIVWQGLDMPVRTQLYSKEDMQNMLDKKLEVETLDEAE
ncbi:hypothetical protein HDV02_000381, partial [Globomyces sp. JEL0801]